MGHDLNLRSTLILSSWFSSLLFGILLVVDFEYARLVITMRGRLTSRHKRIMSGLMLIQLLIAGVHCAIFLQQAIYAFVVASSPEAFAADVVWSNMVQKALYFANNLIADGVLTWRLFIVYGQKRWIVYPYGILIIASIITCVCGLRLDGIELSRNISLHATAAWLSTYWALSIAIQVSASCLIAYKIMSIQRQTQKLLRYSKPMSVVWMVLESGATLSILNVILIAFYENDWVASDVMTAINGQIAALVPATIMFRVGLSQVSSSSTDPTLAPPTLVEFQRDIGGNRSGTMTGSFTTSAPATIDIQQEVELYDFSKKEIPDRSMA